MPKVKRPRKLVPAVIDKAPLAKAIVRFIDDNELSQIEASYIIRDSPTQLSLIAHGRLKGFSAERLLRVLLLLGNDVDIRIRKSKKEWGKVRVTEK